MVRESRSEDVSKTQGALPRVAGTRSQGSQSATAASHAGSKGPVPVGQVSTAGDSVEVAVVIGKATGSVLPELCREELLVQFGAGQFGTAGSVLAQFGAWALE